MVLNIKMDLKAYWVGFNHIRGIGAARMKKLIQFFGNLSVAWSAPLEGLIEAGLSEKLARGVIEYRNAVDPNELLQALTEKAITILTIEDHDYPKKLKEIDLPPAVLYMLGDITPADEWAIAVVGTRRMSGYGKQVTTALADYLANHGITVVSGMARGIDAAAHTNALKAGGRTIAVLGSGVDVIYPPENRKLYDQIIENGAVISDYPPGTAPEASNFPPRNRIISGLSSATVVIEAGRKSGALITSNFAAEQGREVFAVPGNIFAAQCKGTNYLIQQGARPLVDFDELLEILQFQNITQQKVARMLLPENNIESTIMEALSDHPIHINDIHIRTGIRMEVLISTLTILQLKGMVYQAGNMNYAVIRDQSDLIYGGE
jgi:DNA processing protein